MQYSSESDYNILEDETATGKKRDWKGKKSRSDLMAKHYEGLHERIGSPYYSKKAQKMFECAEQLWFKRDPETGKLKHVFNDLAIFFDLKRKCFLID